MIVYSGKQWGNDFNNGDEALFHDAERPRDNDKFKLRPGLQSDKWDWRGSNKNTDFSHAMIKGGCSLQSTGAGKQLLWTIPKIQTTWTQNEIDSLGIPAAFTSVVPPETLKMEKENNPFVLVKSGDITYLTGDGDVGFTTKSINTTYFEIDKSGLYYIMCWGKFCFDTSYFDSNNSYKYKEWVCLAQNIDGIFTSTDMTQMRACGNGDVLRLTEIARFPKGAQLTTMVAQLSFSSGSSGAFGAIELVRLG